MRVPFFGDRTPPTEDEWSEVPVYANIKRSMETWVVKAFNLSPIGLEHTDHDGGLVLASNHASYLDPVFIGALYHRPVHYMAKSDLFRHPLSAAFFRRAGQVKVDRVAGGNTDAVDALVRVVERGRVAGVFPEGSRSLDGRLRRGRTGVARVALRTGAPILPVALTSHGVLPKHSKFPNLDEPLVVAFGKPMLVERSAKRAQDREACRRLTDEVMQEIARLLEVARTRKQALAYDEES